MMGPLFLFAALAATSNAAGAAPAPAAEPATTSEVIDLDADGHQRLTVPITIDGVGPFAFLVDTGAQATVLSREIADRLQLNDRVPATLVGLASRAPIETVAVDGLTLGKHNFNVPYAPLLDAANLGQGVDGILGIDGLQKRRVLLDFIKRKIEVADADELGGNRGYEIVVKAHRKLGQLIITDAMVNGVKTTVLVDTGAQGSVVNSALIKKLRARQHDTTELTDVNGTRVEGPVHKLDSLTMDRMQINDISVFVVDSPALKALGLDDKPTMVLGMNELRMFRRVAIDFESRSILFDVPRTIRGIDAMVGARIG